MRFYAPPPLRPLRSAFRRRTCPQSGASITVQNPQDVQNGDVVLELENDKTGGVQRRDAQAHVSRPAATIRIRPSAAIGALGRNDDC